LQPRLLPAAELLEKRSLLSNFISISSPIVSTLAVEKVVIKPPSEFISDQSSAIDVTLVRQPFSGTGENGAAQAESLLAQPLTVNLVLSKGQVPGSTSYVPLMGPAIPTATAVIPSPATVEEVPHPAMVEEVPHPAMVGAVGGPISPVWQQSVNFGAGVTSITVPVPIKDAGVTGGLAAVTLSVSSAGSNVWETTQNLYLVSGTDALPPAITSAQVVTAGNRATSIAITFSKPMNPATVQNVSNYSVLADHFPSYSSSPLSSYLDYVGYILTGSRGSNPYGPVPLKAAHYNSSTNTVFLIPRTPLNTKTPYTILNPVQVPGNAHLWSGPLLDLQGTTLFDGTSISGRFSITVAVKHPYSNPAPVLVGGN
jgi:hypothetical protein